MQKVSLFSVETSLSYSAEKFRGEQFKDSENFEYRKIFMHQRGGGYHDFPSKTFCLTVPEKIVWEPLCCQKKFLIENSHA